jgi:hypothetical protein
MITRYVTDSERDEFEADCCGGRVGVGEQGGGRNLDHHAGVSPRPRTRSAKNPGKPLQ